MREFGGSIGDVRASVSRSVMKRSSGGKAYYMISAVAQKYNIHPQTLRLYEREGLLKPSRTEGNTRLYSEEDLEQLETILSLTRDLGVNLAGVEIILNMRRKIEAMQGEVNEFMEYVKHELARGIGDWEQRLSAPRWSSRRRPISFARHRATHVETPATATDAETTDGQHKDHEASAEHEADFVSRSIDFGDLCQPWRVAVLQFVLSWPASSATTPDGSRRRDGVRRVVRCDCWRDRADARGCSPKRAFRRAISTARSTTSSVYPTSS